MIVVALQQALVLWVNRRHLTSHHAAPAAAAPAPMFDLFRHRGVRDVLIATALITMAWDLQSFLVPIHGTLAGLSASEIGIALGMFSFATFVIRLAMPWLSRSFNEWQVLTFTLVMATLAFALMPVSTALLPLLGVMFLLGLGLGAAQPNVMALLHERAPPGRVGEALEVVRLTELARRRPHQLSGGEMQRVASARALVNKPSLILADEPTGHLDSKNGAEVLSILKNLVKDFNVTLVMVTHDKSAAEVADRKVQLLDGVVV
jgi:hypothetical protein